MDVRIPDQKLEYLNQAARTELERRVADYAVDLLRESGRLESEQRSHSGSPEVTSTHILDADVFLRKRYTRRRRSKAHLVVQSLAYVAALGVGITQRSLKEDWGPLVFVVAVAAAVLFATIALVMDRDR